MGRRRRAASAFAGIAVALVAAITGCQRPGPRGVSRERTVFVRLDSLLPLHPAWRSVQQLDQLLVQVRSLPASRGPGGQAPSLAALPAPLVPRSVVGETPGPGAARLAEPALERIAGLTKLFEARADRQIAELRRAADAEKTVAMEAERRRLLPTIDAAEDAAKRQVDEEKRSLQFRQIVLESREQALLGTTQKEARDELDAVRDRLDAIDRLRASRASDARRSAQARVDAQLKALSTRLDRQTDAQVERRRADLEREARSTMQRYRDEIRSEAVALGRPAAAVSARVSPMPQATLPSPASVAAHTRYQDVRSEAAGEQAPIAALQAQRDRAATAVRDDVRRRVSGLASARMWRVVYDRHAGLADATDELGAALKSQLESEFR